MAPAEASPEVAVHAAEPSEAAVLASAPFMVVASSNACPARRVTVEGTVDKHCTCPVNELYLFPDALVGSCLVCSALVGSRHVCSSLVLCFASVPGLVTYTWTWPSVPPPVPPLLYRPPGLF